MNTVTTTPTAGTDALAGIEARLARIEAQMDRITRVLDAATELGEDLWPAVEGAGEAAKKKLHELDRAGALGFARASLRLVERVATSFTDEDVRLLGDNIVRILETVRNLTQPEALEVANRAALALQHAEEASRRKTGLFRALRDPDVRRGLSVLLAVTKELGAEDEPAPDTGSGETGAGDAGMRSHHEPEAAGAAS